MSLLRKKNLWQAVMGSRLTMALLVIAVFLLSFAVYDRYLVERQVFSRQAEQVKDVSALEARKAELEDRVEYLSNEDGLEAEIRRHFDVALEGEQVVIIHGEKDVEDEIEEKEAADEPKGWWNFLRGLF